MDEKIHSILDEKSCGCLNPLPHGSLGTLITWHLFTKAQCSQAENGKRGKGQNDQSSVKAMPLDAPPHPHS
jgi:hypothetical protein